ncbi:NUDIX domain-containing protein [Granulicoccus phenolivorans]|uniref:NUDIX domain-containing protein n=1 Tax=Granulicoccus phenolivorans TaxID=266854 RepID=UPI00041F9D86|nr:NUDIX domain-containing protein [Granulicoccus phenolivorans]
MHDYFDETITCARGCQHWGVHGAAGVLVHHDGQVLLQQRGAGHHTGTWAAPGGAIELGETPEQAALREAGEEVAGFPEIGPLTLAHVTDHGGWSYSTFLAEASERTPVAPADWESLDIAWVDLERVPQLRLHPGFGKSWSQLVDQLTRELSRAA